MKKLAATLSALHLGPILQHFFGENVLRTKKIFEVRLFFENMGRLNEEEPAVDRTDTTIILKKTLLITTSYY